MQSLFFWNSWTKPYRSLWLAVFFIFGLCLAALWIYYFSGANSVIDWEKIQEQKIIETTIHSFRLGPFLLSVPAESYVIFEYFGGTNLTHNLFVTTIFLAILSIAASLLIAIITTMERFWFFAGTSLFIVFMISLRFDVLFIFGLRHIVVPVIILSAYLLTAFYFKYLKPESQFLLRVSSFILITLLLWLTVLFFSRAENPAVNLMVTAYTPALILTILFILTVAHEILVSFVYITNQGGTGNPAKHFTFISIIYLAYIIITCLHEMGVIHWDFIYINLYLLLSISALLGVWGFRIREPQYENIFPFAPLGAYFYLALGSICFITIAQLLGNANDAALKVIRDFIIFSHAGFGIVFFIYFVSNFLVMMGNNLPVYKLLYKPNRMPYFTFRFAGLIAMLAFVFYSNWREYIYHSMGGFYNYVGDMYLLQGDEAYAMSFYEQSRSRAFQNNRANYSLARLKTDRLDFEKARYNYELSNGKRPTEFSLVNEGNLEYWSGRYFDAIRTFKKASATMPGSKIIHNNLGHAYAKVHVIDSAILFLNSARQDSDVKASAEANFFAMTAVEFIPINADSVLRLFGSGSKAVEGNALALSALFSQDMNIATPTLEKNRPLDLYSATWLNNYMVKNVKEMDTAFIAGINRIASDSVNLHFKEALKATLANAYYYQNKIFKAFEIYGELAYISQSDQGKFNYIMGLWSLEQGNPRKAADYFNYAEEADYKNGKFYRAIALTEGRQIDQALTAWDSLSSSDDSDVKDLALQMIRILRTPVNQVMDLPDGGKYQFVRYRLALKDTVTFHKIISSFANVNYQAQSLFDFSERYFKAGQIVPAVKLLNRVNGLKITDELLFNRIRFLELRMLSSRNELRQLAQQVSQGITFDKTHELDKILYAAQLAELNGDMETANRNYEIIAHANPYFEEGILAATGFFRNQDSRSVKPYSILTEAIYLNTRSIRLLRAYAEEALRQGFDEYAASAASRLSEAQKEELFQ